MLVVIEKAFADASAAAKTVRDSFMVVDIIIGVGGNSGGIMLSVMRISATDWICFTDVLPYIAG